MPPPDDRPTFPELVATELKSARQQFPRFASRDEAFGVILEEIDEFWDKVKHHQREWAPPALLRELIQIAAMCQRAVEDLDQLA